MADVSETLAPKSDQLDNIDLRGSEPRIFTVTEVDVKPGAEQPVTVHLAEFDRPWKPGKNMRRVLAHCWGRESDNWVGKRVELFSDERVKFGNETPGGTRISRLSGIDGPKSAPVMLSQGRAGTYKVDPLPDAPAHTPVDPHQERIDGWLAAYASGGITHAMLEAHEGRAVSEWDEGNVANLSTLFEALKSGEKKKADEFPELAAADEDADA